MTDTPYLCGGYFISRRVVRPTYVSASALPARLLSASTCICPTAPDAWAIQWVRSSAGGRQESASKFGIHPDELPRIIDWVTAQIDANNVGFPNVFMSMELAYEFARLFLKACPEPILYGIGLYRRFADRITTVRLARPNGVGTPGIELCLAREMPLPPTGYGLGHEILCYDRFGGTFHSWLCNGLETVAADRFQTKLNGAGLIDQLATATQIADYCGSDEVGAEPGVWLPWLVNEYPAVSNE